MLPISAGFQSQSYGGFPLPRFREKSWLRDVKTSAAASLGVPQTETPLVPETPALDRFVVLRKK